MDERNGMAQFVRGKGQMKEAPTGRRRGWKWLAISAVVVVLLIVLGAAGFFVVRAWLGRVMQASLPQLDGQIHVGGLSAPVEVRRDAHGVPHIKASSIDNMVFAQAYVTAQDRLWQMDVLRRHAAGELAEVMGSKLVEHDKVQRYLQLKTAADAALPYVPTQEMHWLTVYAAGVNAFIETHQDALQVEFKLLGYKPRKWEPRDSLLVIFSMAQELGTGFPTKLGREVLTSKLKPELLADLYPVGSWRDHPPGNPMVDLTAPDQDIPDVPLDESQTKVDIPARVKEILSLEKTLAIGGAKDSCRECTAGSNEWVVSGAKTASGKPLLSNDMHLGLQIPGVWYEADVQGGGFHAAGVTMPGAPFVIVGHNQHIAWGFTSLLADVQDLYVEKLRPVKDGHEFQRQDGSWAPVEKHVELVHVKGSHDVQMEVSYTQHGAMKTPIITPIAGEHEKRPLALAWTMYDPKIAGDVPFYGVGAAQSWEQFCTAFRGFGAPALNAVYADDQGHIGYHAIGKVPIRGNADHSSGLSPVPVTDGSYEWSGYIPFELMPQAYDPSNGVLATANSRVTPEGYPHSITLNWESPYRNERIWKWLENKNRLSPEDMLSLQTDVFSELDKVMAQRLAYAIDHSSTKDKRVKQAADLMRTWDGQMTVDGPVPAIVESAREALWPMILKPQLGESWELYQWEEKDFVEEELAMHTPARWLPAEYASWSELLTAAVAKGLTDAHAPSDLSHWKYGDMHTIDVVHPVLGSSWILRRLIPVTTDTGVFPRSGNRTTVNAVRNQFGPSERFTADFSDWDKSTMNLPVGQSGDPVSPYYKDQWPYWYGGKTFAMPFTDSAVGAATVHTLTLAP